MRPPRASATASRARIARVAEALGPATPTAAPAAMASPTVFLVTGCSRGIGIEWAKQILARGDSLIATCRSPDSALQLRQLLGAPSPAKQELPVRQAVPDSGSRAAHPCCSASHSAIRWPMA